MIQSDNAPTQYKNHHDFALLQKLVNELHMRIISTYVAPGHVKGTIDATSSFGVKNIFGRDKGNFLWCKCKNCWLPPHQKLSVVLCFHQSWTACSEKTWILLTWWIDWNKRLHEKCKNCWLPPHQKPSVLLCFHRPWTACSEKTWLLLTWWIDWNKRLHETTLVRL